MTRHAHYVRRYHGLLISNEKEMLPNTISILYSILNFADEMLKIKKRFPNAAFAMRFKEVILARKKMDALLGKSFLTFPNLISKEA